MRRRGGGTNSSDSFCIFEFQFLQFLYPFSEFGGFFKFKLWLQKWFDHFFFILIAANRDWRNLGISVALVKFMRSS